MGKKRTPAEVQVAELLQTARASLRLSTAFLSRMDGNRQTLQVVETSVPLLFPEGVQQVRSATLCQATLDGKLPAVIPDLTDFPEAMRLPSAWVPRIRSYVSVPVRLRDGTLYGTLCAAGLRSDPELGDRDRALMEVLARAAAMVIEPTIAEEAKRADVISRLQPLMRRGGPAVVVQPIVDLVTGRRVGAEALSRFPSEWNLAPDRVFAEAHSVGLGDELEGQALRRAAAFLDHVTGYVAMNVSPATLMTPKVGKLLARAPLARILLELSEHDQVVDYDRLAAVLAPLRAAGMRLAIDDVGAGFSSLRHIIVTNPDVIKIDRTIVLGVGQDAVLSTLVNSLVQFAAGCGAQVVAEGVETAEDAARLRELGVDYGQGWLFGRPGPADALREWFDPGAETAAESAAESAASAVPGPRKPVDTAVHVPG